MQDEIKADPFSGVNYVFLIRRADRVQLMFWDRTVCACWQWASRAASSLPSKNAQPPIKPANTTRTDVLSPRMLRTTEDLAGGWRQLDERIENLSREIETIADRMRAAIAS